MDVTNKERLKKTLFRKAYCDLNTKCWIQPKPTGSCKYPAVKINKKSYLSHRLSAYIYFGFDFLTFNRKGKNCVLHSCDNVRCFNPDHLWIGSYLDNNADCLKKGRGNKPKGETHPKAKLTEIDVLNIIERCHKGERYYTVAQDYKITPENVGRLFRGDSWKYLRVQRSTSSNQGKYSHVDKERTLQMNGCYLESSPMKKRM